MKFVVITTLFMLCNLMEMHARVVPHDSIGNDNKRTFLSYGSFGMGFGTRGGAIGMGYTFVTSNNWGYNISMKTSMVKSKDTPPDYFSDGHRTFSPKDYLNILSFNAVIELPIPESTMRFGIESGLSWVRYGIAEIEPNPAYDPVNGSWWYGSYYKYHKSHFSRNTLGLALKAKMEFLPGRHFGFDLSVFSNLNPVKSLVGMEFTINFGKVRD